MFISVLFLLLCLIVLGLGPVLHPLIAHRHKLMAFLDGFVLTAVLALLFCNILPHAMESQGLWVLLIAFLGMMIPGLIEKLGTQFAKASHQTTLILAIIGLAFHMFVDGIALIQPDATHGDTNIGTSIVPIAIFLHSIPMALMVWWIIRPITSLRASLFILLLLGLSLVLGFGFGFYVAVSEHHTSFGLFEGLVVGSLLHVMFHRHTPHDTNSSAEWQWPAGFGSLVAIAVGFVLNLFVPVLSHSHYWTQTSNLFYDFAILSAPALLLAYLAGGFIQAFLPKASVQWLQKGSSFKQAFKGMMFGLPLPVCSCGVVPLYKSLVHRGTPIAAALAFFVATPELGFDAILLSLPLLGQTMMFIRLIAAAVVALSVGWLMGMIFKKSPMPSIPATSVESEFSFQQKLLMSFKSAFGEILDHTGPWIIVGIVIAVLIEPLLSTHPLQMLASHWQVPLMALIGMPMYVCASGATPLVAVLMANGLSPGAALAFLITGPATNVTTFGILAKLHSQKVATLFAALMFVIPVCLGYVVNWFFPTLSAPNIFQAHTHGATLVQKIALGILVIAFMGLLLRKGPRHLINQIVAFENESGPETLPHEHPHDQHHNHKQMNSAPNNTHPAKTEKSCCH